MTPARALVDDFIPAQARVSRNLVRVLDRLKVTKPAYLTAGGLGSARVSVHYGGFFDFDDSAWRKVDAFITPVWSRTWTTADHQLRSGDPRWWPALVDLLAWWPDDPGQWKRRTGAADWLGVDPAIIDPGGTFRVCGSPLAWLRALSDDPGAWAGCPLAPFARLPAGGVVKARTGPDGEPVDYLRDCLGHLGAVVCDDDGHAERVHAALRARPKGPTLPAVRVAA